MLIFIKGLLEKLNQERPKPFTWEEREIRLNQLAADRVDGKITFEESQQIVGKLGLMDAGLLIDPRTNKAGKERFF